MVLRSRSWSWRLALVLALVLVMTIASEAGAATKRVLLVGDSWAQIMWGYKTVRTVFQNNGLGAYEEEGTYTCYGGTSAAQWAANLVPSGQTLGALDLVTRELNKYPSIDIVQVSLGLNDLWTWKVYWTQSQTNTLVTNMKTNLQKVVNHILSVRSDIKVVLLGYDYMNFTETVDPTNPVYYSAAYQTWVNMGRPTQRQYNDLIVAMGNAQYSIAQSTNRCYYVQNYGLLQWVYGYGPYAAQQVPYPGYAATNYVPFPGGDVNYPTPLVAMSDKGGGVKDAIHLTQDGYKWLVQNGTQQYYQNWLQGVTTPGKASNPTPSNGATGVSLTADLRWTAGVGALSHNVYFGTSLVYRGNSGATTFDVGTLAYGTTYYWRIDEVYSGQTVTGDTWSFTTLSAPKASSPSPSNAATNVSVSADLSWTGGTGATSYTVYFGSTSLANMGTTTTTTFDTGTMANSTKYYWRIDTNYAGQTVTGDTWSFTTAAAAKADCGTTPAYGEGGRPGSIFWALLPLLAAISAVSAWGLRQKMVAVKVKKEN